jgi:agmatine deiminase
MITDKEANKVYFSKKILDAKYLEAFERIKLILDKHNVEYDFLKETKDIWCRDYMPIQIDKEKIIQFKYEPSYLKDDLDLQSIPKDVLKANKFNAIFSKINLDGGNVVRSSNSVIITNRIFKENKEIDKEELVRDIELFLETKVYLIPDITDDMTGHSDGHVRFVDNKTLLVNALEQELKYWQKGFYKMIKESGFKYIEQKGFYKMIKESGFKYIEMPWFSYSDKHHKDTAIGIYVNYLEIGNLIIFPIFEIPGNKDKEAIKIITEAFPNHIIETVNINKIANEGGLLNCISWTIKV